MNLPAVPSFTHYAVAFAGAVVICVALHGFNHIIRYLIDNTYMSYSPFTFEP